VKSLLLLAAALICCANADVQSPPASDLETRILDLNAQAVEKGKQGDYRAAAALLEQARASCRPPSVVRPGLYPSVLANLADAQEQLGNWTEAIQLLQQAVDAEEKSGGPSSPAVARMQVKLASALVVIGNFTEAEPLLHSAIAVQRNAPKEDRFQLALSLTALALLQLNLNRAEEAEHNASEAVALARAENVENADYASMLGVLGSALVVEGQRARALPLLNQSIAMLGKTLSPDHNRVAPVLVQRGLLEAADHKYGVAEQDMNHAIAILDRTSGAGGPNADWARFRLARVYMDEKKLSEAETVLAPAVDRQRKFFGGPNIRLAFYIRELARLRAMEKRWDEAGSLYREAIAMAAVQPPAVASEITEPREMAALDPRPAREKDVRRLEHQANEIFGFRTAE